MPDYAAIAAKCKDGLGKAGVAMTLTRPAGNGVYDPATGEYVYGGEAMDYPVTGLILSGGNPSNSSGERFFNGTLVQTDDQMVMLAASGLSIIPGPGDKLTIGSETFSVVSQVPVMPGGVPLMYRVLARK